MFKVFFYSSSFCQENQLLEVKYLMAGDSDFKGAWGDLSFFRYVLFVNIHWAVYLWYMYFYMYVCVNM